MAVTLFAACSVDMSVDVATQPVDVPEELYVSFDGEDTRIQLGEAGLPVWTKGDLVSVFYRSNANSKYQFTGETGDADGSIKLVEEGTATQVTSQIVAVYPYSTDYWFNWNTYNVEAFLPAEQTYCEDSFGVGSSIMVSSSEYKSLTFKNVCGWIKLQFTGNQIVETIAFKGNNGEQVAGEIYINTSDASCELASGMGSGEGVGGFIEEEGNVLTEVTLNCGEYGVQLDKNTPTAFYIALPPQTFEKGFSVTLTCQDDTTKTISTSNAITIERNHILPMGAIEVVMEVPSGNATFAANTITWNYTDDAEQDANLYDDSAETVAVYSRDIELSVAENNLPNGMTIDELIANSDDLLSVTVNGEASEGVALSVNSEGKYILHIDDFDWNTTYDIEFAYENTSELKGDKYAATLSTTVTTVGRSNELIELSDETTVMYADNLLFDPFTENAPIVDLMQIYSTISAAYDITNFVDADAFLTEMFETTKDANKTKVNTIISYDVSGKELEQLTNNETLWGISSDYSTMSVGYNYALFNELPNKLVYTKRIILWYGQEVEIVMTINVNYPKFDFVYSSDVVSVVDNVLMSFIKPSHYPNYKSTALSAINSCLDLNAAFRVIDFEGNTLSADDLVASGLTVKFTLDNDYDGITITDDNILEYYGYADKVGVRGHIYMTNDEGQDTELTTVFDNDAKYAGYYVTIDTSTFTPFKTPQIKNDQRAILSGSKEVASVNLLKCITLNDFRGAGLASYPVIDTEAGAYVVGDDSNGYAKDLLTADIYHITIIPEITEYSISGYEQYFSFNTDDNQLLLNFDASQMPNGFNIRLITVTIKLTIKTPWSSKDMTMTVTLQKVG